MTTKLFGCSVLLALAVLGGCSGEGPVSRATTDATGGDSVAPTTSPTTTDQLTPESLDPTSEADETSAPEVGPTPISTVEPIQIDPATVTAPASSELAPAGRFTYHASNTLDGDLQTAWNHDNSDSGLAPEGQLLRYTFADAVDLTRIEIVNGYVQTQQAFEENARVRQFVIQLGPDEVTVAFPLLDTSQVQALEHNFGMVTEVTLIIESVYPGSVYQDVAITEVVFYAEPSG